MSHVILERSYTPPLPPQMSYDLWELVNRSLDACLDVWDWKWLRSFITLDGSRSICELEAPYAEVVREACRKANMPFDQVWRAELRVGQNPEALISCQNPVLAKFIHDPPITQEGYELAKQKANPCLREAGVQPLATLMSLNGEQSICLFEARSAEDVRLAFRKAGLPFQSIWRSQLILPSEQ